MGWRMLTLTQMLSWLEVSKSGFYEWRDRAPSATEQRRERLKVKIAELFKKFEGTYGYRRIHAELVAAGEQVGDELVRQLMRELGLVPIQPRPYRTTTIRGEHEPDVPDLVARDFTAERPGMKLVGDITYIPTWQGWLYLATVIDCFNKEVIGYAMADHMRTELVTDALKMAAQNHDLESVHSAACDERLGVCPGRSIGHEGRGRCRNSVTRSGVHRCGTALPRLLTVVDRLE